MRKGVKREKKRFKGVFFFLFVCLFYFPYINDNDQLKLSGDIDPQSWNVPRSSDLMDFTNDGRKSGLAN